MSIVPAGHVGKILVVDDDQPTRETIVEYLKTFGHTDIVQASDGIEALSLLNSLPIKLVISDWEMPKLSGMDLLKAMRHDPRMQDIPFIMVTSPISKERLKIAEAAHSDVDGYLIKPFVSNILREKIDDIVFEKSIAEKKAVLVVEDDECVMETIEEILKSMNYGPIYRAKDGYEGFKELKAHSEEIALVVSDWEMPNLSGIEFLRRIRIDKDLSSTPFIMVTAPGANEKHKIQEALQAEVNYYLVKPFSVKDLRGKVEQTIQEAKMKREIERRLEKADQALGSNQAKDAERNFRQVLKLNAKHFGAGVGLAKALMLQDPKEGFEEAHRIIHGLIAQFPKLDRGYVELAWVYEKNRSLENALDYVYRGLNQLPSSATLHYHAGRLLLRLGKSDESLLELQRALDLDPNMQEAQDLLTEIKSHEK